MKTCGGGGGGLQREKRERWGLSIGSGQGLEVLSNNPGVVWVGKGARTEEPAAGVGVGGHGVDGVV